MKKIWTIIGIVVVCIFALIGAVLTAGYVALELGWTKTSGIVDSQHDYFQNQSATDAANAWAQTDEWATLKAAVVKDKDVIERASAATGVPARMIVAPLVVEQLRLFYSDREIYKAIFAPLKMLGNQSQFSWGVMGIKQDTARQVEDNLAGTADEHLLAFPATSTAADADAIRFARLTDEHNRYYSYLYGALLIKELETQWKKAGFPIDGRPEIIATLFNIGFQNSKPHAGPQAGGAQIDIGSSTYSFGGLAGDFYYSNELTDVFPR